MALRNALFIGWNADDSGNGPRAEYPGFWDGKLDEIAVFNRALSPIEIRKLFRGQFDDSTEAASADKDVRHSGRKEN